MGGSSSSSSSEDEPLYGDINKVETTGASYRTAQQDNLGYKGKRASHTMAETDEERMMNYKSMICTVAGNFKIDPAIIAGIISRESRAGNTLNNGWGDWNPRRRAYNAWGLMQVDVNPQGGGHIPKGEWNSKTHLHQGTQILVDFIKKIQTKFPTWSKEQQLKGGIAAYNIGDRKIPPEYENVDINTTGKDYSNDVVARAQWYKRHMFDD